MVQWVRHGPGDRTHGFWILGPNRFTSLGLSLSVHGVVVIKSYSRAN